VYIFNNVWRMFFRRRFSFIGNALCVILLLVTTNLPLAAQPATPDVAATVVPQAAAPEAAAATASTTVIATPMAMPTEPAFKGNAIDGHPVFLGRERLFVVRIGIPGIATAKERADAINERILKIANDLSISPDAIHVEEGEKTAIVMANQDVLLTIGENDEKVHKISRQELGKRVVAVIQKGIQQYREERSLKRLIQGILATLISTVAVFMFFRGLLFVSSKLFSKVNAASSAGRLNLQFRNIQLLGSNATSYLLNVSIRLLRLALVLACFYLYVPFVLSQFPPTKALGTRLLQNIAYQINLLAQSFVGYLPNFVVIGVIALVTYYIIGFIEKLIAEFGRPDFYPWFYPEWIQPTTRLATFLAIAIACVVASPYLPGFGSPAFQGVSLFLGALVTLGSSSAVSNAVSGLILIYTRSFQLGDHICLGEITGIVNEKSLFVTRILTLKKEIVTIPNLSVLNSNLINYSAICRESKGHLLLHTTITLGYDAPWRKVHAVLVDAAKATAGIVSEPNPFVLQTSLNDFHVSYEINAYTDRPQSMPAIYSELHQNIQDYCNQAGIEILSPGFSALRDGNHSTIPADYLPPDYQSPTFSIRHQDGQ
jgi:small-conductance mechanosensitive channel